MPSGECKKIEYEKSRLKKIGEKHSRFTIIGIGEIKGKRYTFDCKCECGNIRKNINYANLKKGTYRSCGCLRKDENYKYHENEYKKKRIEKNIKKNGLGCWEWQKRINFLGYGQIKSEKKTELAHRVSYKVFIGEIPENKCVLHTCDNRKCVNPEHLWVGDDIDNAKDRMEKGRNNHYKKRLDKEDVKKIRKAYPQMSMTKLAKKYERNLSCIWCILTNKTWKNI